jgi:hypothetical protein
MMKKFTSFNPFYGIIETNRFPHARTLRTSFSEKMEDAFAVLFGELDKEPTYPGLFDYATFFLRSISNLSFDWLVENNASIIALLLLPIIIPIIWTAMAVVSLIWFIIALPIVGVIHLASTVFAKDDKEQALNLEGQESNGHEHTLQENPTLRLFLAHNEMQMNDIVVNSFTSTSTEPTTESDVYDLSISKRTKDDNTTAPQFTAKCTARQAQAFFRLNIGNMTGQCEENQQPDVINKFFPTT